MCQISKQKTLVNVRTDCKEWCIGIHAYYITINYINSICFLSCGMWCWVDWLKRLRRQQSSSAPLCELILHLVAGSHLYCHAIMLQVTDTIQSYNLNFHTVPHGIRVYCERYTMEFLVCYGSQNIMNVKKSGGADGGDVSSCMSRPAHAITIPWPNTDSAMNMPITLPSNQLLICYMVTSPVHTVMKWCFVTQ
jgi:hypothetical protein